MAVTKAVLGYLIRDGQILLIRKKRGHGRGKWNGPGGRMESGESPEHCLRRELKEEIGIRVTGERRLGNLSFYENERLDWFVYLFLVEEYEGEPKESKEAYPLWFSLDKIPYERMWEDDRHWLPLVIEEKSLRGDFWFEKGKLVRYSLSPKPNYS